MNLLPYEQNGVKYFNLTQLAVKFGVHPTFFTEITSHFPPFLMEKYICKIKGSFTTKRNHFTEEFCEKFFPVIEELRKTHVGHSKRAGSLEEKFIKKVREILEEEYAIRSVSPPVEEPENKDRITRKEWNELSMKISFIYDLCISRIQK